MNRMTDEEFFALPDHDPSAPEEVWAFGQAVTKEEGAPLYVRDGVYWVLQVGRDGSAYRSPSWRP